MPLDTSIALQTRGIQLDNPLDVQTKQLTLQHLMGQGRMQDMQMQQAQQAQEQERAYGRALQQGVGPDGQVNYASTLSALAQSGNGKGYAALLKQQQDAQKAQADLGHTNAQTGDLQWRVVKGKLDATGAAMSSLLSKPDVTHDDAIGAIVGLVQQGVVDAPKGQQMVASLPGNPQALRQFLMQKGLEVMDASKRMDLMTPKTDVRNMGGSDQVFNTNQLTGQVTPGASFARTQSPDSVASVNATVRGQNMTDARSREGNDIARQAARTQVVETPDGYALVDKGTGLARPAATMNGAQVQGKDNGLNDTQSKALLFGSRMRDADKILAAMEAEGVKTPSLVKRAAEGVPLVGGALGMAANATVASPKQQQVEQAQRDFVNAVLRRESGAAIATSEFDSASRQYFPQPGDSGAVLKQKQQNRQLAVQGLLAEVPAKRRDSIGGGAAPATPQVDTAAGVPDDIAAILRKHGGK